MAKIESVETSGKKAKTSKKSAARPDTAASTIPSEKKSVSQKKATLDSSAGKATLPVEDGGKKRKQKLVSDTLASEEGESLVRKKMKKEIKSSEPLRKENPKATAEASPVSSQPKKAEKPSLSSGKEDKAIKSSKDKKPAKPSAQSKQPQQITAKPENKTKKRKASPAPAPDTSSDDEDESEEKEEGLEQPSADESDEPGSSSEESVHLHGFSTDDDDSSDDEEGMNDDPLPIDLGKLPTIAKDDAIVKRKLEKAKRKPVRSPSLYLVYESRRLVLS